MVIEPYNVARVVAKSDATDGSGDIPLIGSTVMAAIYACSTGDITLIQQDGKSVLFTGVVVGTILPMVAKRIASTGTGAGPFVVLYRI